MSWKQVRLGEILNISKGKKHKEAPFDNSNYRYISIEDLNGGNEKNIRMRSNLRKLKPSFTSKKL